MINWWSELGNLHLVLNMEFIGMAGAEEDFTTLNRFAEEAKMFGAQATFNRPNLNASSLSQIVTSSLASSLSSKLELTSLKTGTTRSVRTDVEREKLNAPDDLYVNDDWRVFLASSENSYVGSVYSWSSKLNDFCRVIDPRCLTCYKIVAESEYTVLRNGGSVCPGCRSCFFCGRCQITGGYRTHRYSKECKEFAEQRRQGFLVGKDKCPLAFSVAWKKKAFGEGAERLAFKFRFVDASTHTGGGTSGSTKKKFIGPVMVAKESRFTEDLNDEKSSTNYDYLRSHRHFYHKSFMRTQATAQRFARMYNSSLEGFDQLRAISYPTISFVEPLVFELEDATKARTYNVLVEPMITGKYQKFTTNFGDLGPELKRDFNVENEGVNLDEAAVLLGRENVQGAARAATATVQQPSVHPANLGIIEEGSEDDEEEEISSNEEEEDESDADGSPYGDSWEPTIDLSCVRDTDYLATFSHFTYVRSGGKLMVVDLQGALQKQTNDGSNNKSFVLTDPAIHHRTKRSDKRARQYGRTDLGRKGMRAFFETHRCNNLCKLFQFREKTDLQELDNLYNAEKYRPAPTTSQHS